MTSTAQSAHLVLLAAIVVLTGCGKRERSTAQDRRTLPVASVRVQPVEPKKRMATEDVVGTVRARLRAIIEAKVSGRIDAMLVSQGQSVAAEQMLLKLDSREIQARLEQTLAQRMQAERDLKRVTTLVEQNTLPRQEFDAAESRASVTRAAVSEAETMLAHTRITAPFSGVITRKLSDVGDLAAPGKALLEIEDPSTLRFEADVPEALFGRIRMGAKLPVRIPALELEFNGTITEIAPSADPVSRTFLVKLDVPQSGDLRAGLFGRVAVPVNETTSLRVPATAVVVRGQLEMVFVVANGHANLRLVKTGKRIGDEIEVLAGLQAGDRVVIDRAASLVDTQPVELRP